MSSSSYSQAINEISHHLFQSPVPEEERDMVVAKLRELQPIVESTVRGCLSIAHADLGRSSIDLNYCDFEFPTIVTNTETGQTLPETLVEPRIDEIDIELQLLDGALLDNERVLMDLYAVLDYETENGRVSAMNRIQDDIEELEKHVKSTAWMRVEFQQERDGWENCTFETLEQPDDLYSYVLHEEGYVIDQKLAHELGFILLKIEDNPAAPEIEGEVVIGLNGWGLDWASRIAAYLMLRYRGCHPSHARIFDTPASFYSFRDTVGDDVARRCASVCGVYDLMYQQGYFEYNKEQFA